MSIDGMGIRDIWGQTWFQGFIDHSFRVWFPPFTYNFDDRIRFIYKLCIFLYQFKCEIMKIELTQYDDDFIIGFGKRVWDAAFGEYHNATMDRGS